MLPFAVLLACTGHIDTPPDRYPAPGPEILAAPLPGTGFGAALSFAGDGRLWIGAPFGDEGIVYTADDDGVLSEVLRHGGKAGAALSADPSGSAVAIGAPLSDGFAGAVLDADGAALAGGGSSMGLALCWADGWVAAHASGWRSADRSQETASRPTALAAMQRDDGDGSWQIAAGMAHGAKMLQVGEVTLTAPPTGAEAGYALAAGDVDDDGEPEWIVGAPAAGRVYIVSADASAIEQTLSGEGRFGHALAVADVDQDGTADLVVGAPMADDADGAVYLFDGGVLDAPAVTWTPSRSGAMLGFAVAARPGEVAAGGDGFVFRLTP